MTATHREPAEADVFRQKNAFVAKAAPDVRRNDPHLRLHQPQAFREAGPHDVRHLTARIQNELVHAAVPIGDGAAPLDRSHAFAGGGDLASNFDRRVESGFDVDVDECLKEGVVAPMLMYERRIRRSRREHVVHSRQLVEIDLDACSNILGLGPRPADAHRDQLADLSYLVDRENRVLRRLESWEAGYGDDRLHIDQVRGKERLAAMLVKNANGAQLCMRERRADESDVFHACEADVTDKLAAPTQEAVVLLALN